MAVAVDHPGVAGILAAYALDACEPDDAAAVEAHIGDCDACAAVADRLNELAGWIGMSEPAVPPADLRARILGPSEPAGRGLQTD